jgi:hypothetical protein
MVALGGRDEESDVCHLARPFFCFGAPYTLRNNVYVIMISALFGWVVRV